MHPPLYVDYTALLLVAKQGILFHSSGLFSLIIKFYFLLQPTISNQHYEEQNSNFLILDCRGVEEFNTDFRGGGFVLLGWNWGHFSIFHLFKKIGPIEYLTYEDVLFYLFISSFSYNIAI